MHPATEKTRRLLRKLPTQAARLSLLRNRYAGQRCYLVACGPSTGRIPPAQLRRTLRNELVLTTKHAYDILPGVADLHLLNPYKFKRYTYPPARPIVAATYQQRRQMPRGDYELLLYLATGGGYARTISAQRNFDDWLLTKQPDRWWGPNIVFELGLYLIVHLGVSELITLGVDLNSKSQFWQPAARVRKAVETETRTVVQALPDWHSWLRRHGVTWKYVATDVATPLAGIVPATTL
jgi:hypothetical protein